MRASRVVWRRMGPGLCAGPTPLSLAVLAAFGTGPLEAWVTLGTPKFQDKGSRAGGFNSTLVFRGLHKGKEHLFPIHLTVPSMDSAAAILQEPCSGEIV